MKILYKYIYSPTSEDTPINNVKKNKRRDAWMDGSQKIVSLLKYIFFSVLVAKFHVINLYAADRKSILYIY